MLAQDIHCTDEFFIDKKYNLKMIGEDEKYFFAATDGVYIKKASIYKFDKEMKLVSEGRIPVKFSANLGSAQDKFSKDVFYFGGNLMAIYTIRQKKTATVYYDLYSSEDYSLISKENILYEHHYKGNCTARNMLDVVYISKNSKLTLIMRSSEHVGQFSMEQKDHKGIILRVDKNYKKEYLTVFSAYDLGEMNLIEDNIYQAENNCIYIYSRVYSTALSTPHNEEEFYLSKIDNLGIITTNKHNLNGKEISEFQIYEENQKVWFLGNYKDPSKEYKLYNLEMGAHKTLPLLETPVFLGSDTTLSETLKKIRFDKTISVHDNGLTYHVISSISKKKNRQFKVIIDDNNSSSTTSFEINLDSTTSKLSLSNIIISGNIMDVFCYTNDDIEGSLYQITIDLSTKKLNKLNVVEMCESVSRHIIIRQKANKKIGEQYFIFAKIVNNDASIKISKINF